MPGLNFDQKSFVHLYAKKVRALDLEAKEGLSEVIHFIDDSDEIKDIRHVAYILATIGHETAYTFRPIREFGRGKGRKYGIRDKITGQTYYGRGYVQLTWKYNYDSLGKIVGRDLVTKPDEAMIPEVAWKITEYGMINGVFTGKRLQDYIVGEKCDYVNARRIINGVDKARHIASIAEKIEDVLRTCLIPDAEVIKNTEYVTDPKPPQPIPTEVGNQDVPVEDKKDSTFWQMIVTQITTYGSAIQGFLAGWPWQVILGLLVIGVLVWVGYLVYRHFQRKAIISHNQAVTAINVAEKERINGIRGCQ